MKHLIVIFGALALTACGYSSMGNHLTGQVKRVKHQTPIFCPERVDADLSLGVIRNGVGSMSSEDVWVTVPDSESAKILEAAAQNGDIVDVEYDRARFAFCPTSQDFVRHVTLVK